MRVFKNGNWAVAGCKPCPICGTKKEGEVVLIAINGTGEGFNYEAEQVHLECLDPMIYSVGRETVIIQRFVKKEVENEA